MACGSWMEQVAVVRALLRSGSAADVNQVDQKGWTPLFVAVRGRHCEVVKLLLAHGARVSAVDEVGHTALHLACREGDVTMVKCLLSHGASVDVPCNQGDTPLHMAASSENESTAAEVIDLLMAHGADVHSVNRHSLTPLQEAGRRARTAAVTSLLLRHGASVLGSLEINNVAPLQSASMTKKAEATQVLQDFVTNLSHEWRPSRHTLYPHTFRSAVSTVVALWSWNHSRDAPWHPESVFPLLSLELLFEIFIWLSADILTDGYVVVQGGGQDHPGRGEDERGDLVRTARAITKRNRAVQGKQAEQQLQQHKNTNKDERKEEEKEEEEEEEEEQKKEHDKNRVKGTRA